MSSRWGSGSDLMLIYSESQSWCWYVCLMYTQPRLILRALRNIWGLRQSAGWMQSETWTVGFFTTGMSNWIIQKLLVWNLQASELKNEKNIFWLLTLKHLTTLTKWRVLPQTLALCGTRVFSPAYSLNAIFDVILFLLHFPAATHNKSAIEFQLWIIIFSRGSCTKAHSILSPWEKIVSCSTCP